MFIKDIFLLFDTKAYLEVEVLLVHLLNKKRDFLIAHGDEIVPEAIWQQMITLWQARQQGKPLAYLTHKKEFYGLEFYVDERVLIPRPETELLVKIVREIIKQIFSCERQVYNPPLIPPDYRGDDTLCHLSDCLDQPLFNSKSKILSRARPALSISEGSRDRNSKLPSCQIIDIGTGSGCIAVTLAKLFPDLKITATDISAEALQVAEFNAKRHGVSSQIIFKESDLLLGQIDRPIDIIVANLPYIGTEKYNDIEPTVKAFEPSMALFGGKDGLDLYRRLFREIKELPYKPRCIIGEFGYGQGQLIQEIIWSNLSKAKIEIKRDLAGIERVFIVESF